jgi:hypothetical protein
MFTQNDIKVADWWKHSILYDWTFSRANMIIQILGKEWLKDKNVLEVGAGHGIVGQILRQNAGANVITTDGRSENLEGIRENWPEIGDKLRLLNQEHGWSEIEEKFDLIVHFGVLYHLENWQYDLRGAADHSNLICLETQVVDTCDVDFEFELIGEPRERVDSGLVDKIVIPSTARLEKFITEKLEMSFIRYDDKSLTFFGNTYHWKPNYSIENATDEIPYYSGKRRFYIIGKDSTFMRKLVAELPESWYGTISIQNLNPPS